MPDPLRHAPARLVGMLGAAVLAVVAIGFSTGTSSTAYRAVRPVPQERGDPGDVPPARSHAELEQRPWTSDSGWSAGVSIASQAARVWQEGPADEPRAVASALAERATLRSFTGAPPVVPHPVRAGGAAECLACHGEGFVLGDRRAVGAPHAEFASCNQCHVAAAGPFPADPANPAVEAESRWQGLVSASAGAIAYEGAPPSVPHPTWMRENCDSCHGPEGRAALQTPHPDRRSCLQCHPAAGGPGARASR